MTVADKNIIVILPPEFKLYKAIDKNLQHMGFAQWQVLSPKFKHTFKTRVANFVFKHLLGHKEYKRKIVATYYSNTIARHLKSYQALSVDFIVVVRPDLLQDDALNEVARVARKKVAYQWDGLARFPRVFDVIARFDRFFVFDPNDITAYQSQYPNLLACTNFYFDFPMPHVQVNAREVMYAGAYQAGRVASLVKMVDQLQKYNYELNIQLIAGGNSHHFSHPQIKCITRCVSFLTYLESSLKAGMLLDIKACEHNGLSFRIFEAMRYSKKLITDNATVKRYDFYRPENIFVVENGSFEGLSQFLNTPYVPLPPSLVRKYSFTNWLMYALDIPPYQKTVNII